MNGCIRALLLIITAAITNQVLAAEQLIVRAEPGYMVELASRFSLTILQQIPGQPIFLVDTPGGVPPSTVIQQLLNYDHGGDADDDDDDDDDVLVEIDGAFSLPEPGPEGGSIIGSTDAVYGALNDQTSSSFYGDTVWSSVLTQPALSVIRLPQARRRATGAGIVAIIDTGIDPDHPLLRRWIVRGYDFVRERSGTPSELDDLDPETRAILATHPTGALDTMGRSNGYTTAILDHGAAGRLDMGRLPPHFGHGTMAAGLVRVVAPTAQIMPLKAFDSMGQGSLWAVLRAIYYAQVNGARVINMSLSFDTPRRSWSARSNTSPISASRVWRRRETRPQT